MKRKMICIATAYMLGLFFASFFKKGSDIYFILAIIVVYIVVSLIAKRNKKEIIITIAVSMLSASVYSIYDKYTYETILRYENMNASFSGEIIDISNVSNDKAMYTLKGKINNGISAKIVAFGDSYNVDIEDRMSFDAKFVVPESTYLFDTESYYKSKNIFLTAENITNARIEKKQGISIKVILKSHKEKMISKFNIEMGKSAGGFMSSIVFGDKTGLEDSIKTILYRSGIGHILVVSGIHISLIATFIMTLLKKFRCNNVLAFVILCIFLCVMIIMVDAKSPIIRASIMLILVYSARLFHREADSFNSLAIAVFIISLSNPFIIYDQGFWLSVIGTYGIVVFAPYMTAKINIERFIGRVIKSIATMVCVSLILMPLSLLYFDEVSIISPITNLLFVPLCSVALLLGLIYVFTGGFINTLFFAKIISELIISLTEIINENSKIYISNTSKVIFWLSISSALIVVIVYILSKNQIIIWHSIAVSLAVFTLFTGIYKNYIYNKFKVVVLGKGNNISIIINYKGNVDIIDLSGYYKSAEYVRKYLSKNGISKISTLTLTQKQAMGIVEYADVLTLYEIENLFIKNKLYIGRSDISQNIIEYDNSEIQLDYIDYSITYLNGSAVIKYDGNEIYISPSKEQVEDDFDIVLYYGNLKSDYISLQENALYTDKFEDYLYSEMNNFEIEFMLNDIYIRRL